MRVLVLGGTRFIGRNIVEALVVRGDDVMVCHRGETEPGDPPSVAHLHSVVHLHCDRRALSDHRSELAAFAPEAIVDCLAMSADDVHAAVSALGPIGGSELRWVVLSSMDVYRGFAALQHEDPATDSLPIAEESDVRADRYPYPDEPGRERYSKLDVEGIVLSRGAVVLRLPMVYGPGDYQRREEFVLRRVRAGRPRIPVGAANGILPFAFVDDVAEGVLGAVNARAADVQGEILNLVEEQFDPIAVWMRRILGAAGSDAKLVRVPDSALPADMELAGSLTQPMVVSSEKARRVLGYRDTDRADAVAVSVAWHLAHPPADADLDFSADDRALELAAGV